MNRLKYWKRIIQSYLFNNISQLDFWHGKPQKNEDCRYDEIGQYYMLFHNKAIYTGNLDFDGIPMLNYHGSIGVQYNPIAISQWGLGNYNLYKKNNSSKNYKKFISCSDWLLENLVKNKKGLYVWMHNFDWEYKNTLRAPWYSGLAQGQGLSVLVRAWKETGDEKYKNASYKVFKSLKTNIDNGGVIYTDGKNQKWIEEYILEPPTHILNGFIWAVWGVYDYHLVFSDKSAKPLFDNYLLTIKNELEKYDTGYWSLYELSDNKIRMVCSDFYHQLHIVQLEILYEMSKIVKFKSYSSLWNGYRKNRFKKLFALIHKIIFKVLYY